MKIVFVTNKNALPDIEKLRNDMIAYHKDNSKTPAKKSRTMSAYNRILGQVETHREMMSFWENIKFEINETEQ